ncbi:hypothetical protein [Actinophytocola sp.]|uniref:hypothetical protein n=1 Tax=Actinophytocola sp. TaxID=1872138 RepID=UPI002D3F065C|nr:hypothetical protein [Actinophytocola sp.]HYQ63954.1 hypothetical protein [Actinophytocola sp.]
MAYVIAVLLLVGAVAVLTSPWSRRDPADFTTIELAYAWRGPRGALGGAMRVLLDEGLARRVRGRGLKLTDKPPPADLDPIVRAVYGGLGLPRAAAALLDLEELGDTLPPVAARVIGARLRVGATRRVVGSAAALAAPVVAIMALASGAGYALVGIAVSFVTLLGAWWVMTLRGTTIRGGRTLAAASRPRRNRPRRGALSGLVGTLPTGWITADFGETASGLAVDTADVDTAGMDTADVGGGGDDAGP